ncbi:MAG TPA: transglycosylase, partial [Thermoanaerobaculia bacterium]|nr:transglycosylase [Thermoanaerobaculia bacterium]
PAHAPFVPQKEHACASCAVANLVPPTSAPVFLVPPASRPSPEAHADRAAASPLVPAFSGRSPPSAA